LVDLIQRPKKAKMAPRSTPLPGPLDSRLANAAFAGYGAGMGTVLAVRPVETQHLVLREMERDDAAEFANYMTQPRYQRHITHRLRNEVMVREFVARQVAARQDARRHVYHLAAEEKSSGEVIGDGFIITHGSGSCEIGWGVHPAMWSMGLGTEIGRALLAVGFETLKGQALWCKVMVQNEASARLARRIGMEIKGQREDYPLGSGRTTEVEIYLMSAARYFELPY
jgi:RimJ/RimL family protein N-acetyltransferase